MGNTLHTSELNVTSVANHFEVLLDSFILLRAIYSRRVSFTLLWPFEKRSKRLKNVYFFKYFLFCWNAQSIVYGQSFSFPRTLLSWEQMLGAKKYKTGTNFSKLQILLLKAEFKFKPSFVIFLVDVFKSFYINILYSLYYMVLQIIYTVIYSLAHIVYIHTCRGNSCLKLFLQGFFFSPYFNHILIAYRN